MISIAAAALFTFTTIYEDEYFSGKPLTMENAATIISTDMPKAACLKASRLANNFGGMTACIQQKK